MPRTNGLDTGLISAFVSTNGIIASGTLPQNWAIIPSYTGTGSCSTNVISAGRLVQTDGTYYSSSNSTTVVQVFTAGTGTQGSWTHQNYTGNRCTPFAPPKINHRRIRTKRDQARKALWRSIRLFENLFGINDIKIFIDGGAFEIEGRKFNYRISQKKYNKLLDKTINISMICVPYTLEVLSKQGLVLFEGCTVFKDTPIIDQITALILHIKDNEEHVLLNMNLSKLTDNFFEDLELLTYVNELKECNYTKQGRGAFISAISTDISMSNCTPDEYELSRSLVVC